MKRYLIIALLIITGMGSLYAQEFTKQEIDNKGRIIFAETNEANLLLPTDVNINTMLSKMSGIVENDYTFKRVRSFKDEDGNEHIHFAVYYQGILVQGMDYAVHTQKSSIHLINGKAFSLNNPIIKPSVLENEIVDKAISSFTSPNKDIKNIDVTAKIEQLVFASKDEENYELAYKVFVNSGNNAASSYYAYMSTQTGMLLYKEPLVCTEHITTLPPNALGTAQTRYSGNQNFITDSYKGQYRLREVRNNVNILTLNAHNQVSETQIVNSATDFFDNDNNWTAAEHGIDQSAHDVHWAAEKILDYWQQVRGRNSVDGNGLQIRGFVHSQKLL